MARADGGSVDEQFARLPKSTRRALEENGLDLAALRRLAAEDGGERRVRHIFSEYAPASSGWWDHEGSNWSLDRAGVWAWLRLLLIAVVGVLICLGFTYLIGQLALLVGAACGLAVLWALFKTRPSRGGLVARCLVGAAYVILIWVGSGSADQWYLQVRGQEATVTYVKPEYSESHGVRVTYCRVKLPDGSTRRVFQNDRWCADTAMLGTRRDAVIDPAGHYRPMFGRKSDIGIDGYDYLALGAAVVLVLAPLTAAVMGRANETRSNRGGRVNGTAV